jgi:mannose-6-phosphate isomerase-like protein (cupin superfamily)
MTERYELTPSEAVTIRESSPAALVVEAEYGPGGTPPPKHFHPDQDERFEVLEGTLRVRVAGDERDVGAGESVEIPRGAVHQMWNAGTVPAKVNWTTSPRGRTEQWFRELGALRASGRVGRDGMPGPLAFAVLLTEYRDVFRLAGPQLLLQGAFAALAPLGRARGYRAGLAGEPGSQ